MGIDADEAVSLTIGGFGPREIIAIGDAVDKDSGGIDEGDGFSAVVEVAGVVGGAENELGARGQGRAEREGVSKSGGEGGVAEVDFGG